LVSRRHIIISGTGRAGTTFLVQLLTALGVDTGFSDLTSAVFPACHAGMEWDLRQPDAPYVVKSPWLCDYLDEALDAGGMVIEHALVPIRDLFSAAESRRVVTARNAPADVPKKTGIPGGLWHTDTPEEQEQVLTRQLYKLMHTLARRDIPLTLLDFPRMVHDADYLYGKVACALNGVSSEKFREVFEQVAQPQLVHDFVPSKSRRADLVETDVELPVSRGAENDSRCPALDGAVL
jgi:hypothetical protein